MGTLVSFGNGVGVGVQYSANTIRHGFGVRLRRESIAFIQYFNGYKILSQDLGLVPGFHGDSWDRKTDADRALVWLPRATGMVQIYRAVPSGPNLNCAGRVAPEKLAAGMQRPREVQVPEHGCVRCGTAGEMGALA